MTKKMKILLGVVAAAAAIVAGAYTYKSSHATSPEVEEVEEAEKLNPVYQLSMRILPWLIVRHSVTSDRAP